MENKFELPSLKKSFNSLKIDEENIFEFVRKEVKKDGYVSFNNKDLTHLVLRKLEKVEPEKTKASVLLKEIGVLNVYGNDDEVLLKVLNYCLGVIFNMV